MQIVETTNSASSAAAVDGASRWAETRYGTPQSSVNTIIENCVPMWPKKPSFVPGRPHTARTWRPISRIDSDGTGCQSPDGALRTTASTSRATRTLAPAAAPKAAVQPTPTSSAANGTADRIWPVWQRMVVTCVISGTRYAGNQRGTSARTATNTMASPPPTSTRASTASGRDEAKASRSWPAPSSMPLTTSIARDPKRSTSRPAGIWAAM